MSAPDTQTIDRILEDLRIVLKANVNWSSAGQDEGILMLPVPNEEQERDFFLFYDMEDHELFSFEANDKLHMAIAGMQLQFEDDAPTFRVSDSIDTIERLEMIINDCYDREEMVTVGQLEAIGHMLINERKKDGGTA